MKTYNINYSSEIPSLLADWRSNEWKNAEIVQLQNVRHESSGLIPRVKVKLLYNSAGIAGMFLVEDEYIKCTCRVNMESVWKDSCVEFFVKPSAGKGYFNFEFNCIGVLYASYVLNPLRTENGFKDFSKFNMDDCNKVDICSSYCLPIDGENNKPENWTLQFFIPFSLLEQFTGKIERQNMDGWSCNFYKCADESSHPHWISWSPVKELNFHTPESFGKLLFEKL